MSRWEGREGGEDGEGLEESAALVVVVVVVVGLDWGYVVFISTFILYLINH